MHKDIAAASEIFRLPASGLARLRSFSLWAWLILAVWLVAIVADAGSTLYMSSLGFEEANPINYALFTAIGVVPAVLAVSAWCVVLALTSAGRPVNSYTWVVVVVLLAVMVLKLAVAISNFTLLFWGIDFL